MGPSIESKKLRDYVSGNNSYWIEGEGENFELHFSPEFPEAMGHLPEGKTVEHVMYGHERNGRIYFYRFTTRSAFGETNTDLDGEDDPVMEWLKYI